MILVISTEQSSTDEHPADARVSFGSAKTAIDILLMRPRRKFPMSGGDSGDEGGTAILQQCE